MVYRKHKRRAPDAARKRDRIAAGTYRGGKSKAAKRTEQRKARANAD